MLAVKEIWDYLEEMFSEKNNLDKVYDITHEMFWSEKDNKILSWHYADLNKVYKQLKVLFAISEDMKMQKQ